MKAEEFLKALNGIDSKFIDEADEYCSENNKPVSVKESKYIALIVLSAASVALIVSVNHFTDFHDSNNYEAENMITETSSYYSESSSNTSAVTGQSESENNDKTTGSISGLVTSVSGKTETGFYETSISDTEVFEETDVTVPSIVTVTPETEMTESVTVSITEKSEITEPVSVSFTEKTNITENFTSEVSSDSQISPPPPDVFTYVSSASESEIPPPPAPNPGEVTAPSIIPDIFYSADRKYIMLYQQESEYEKTGQKVSAEKLVFYSEKGEEGYVYDIYSVPDNDGNLIAVRIGDRYYIYKRIVNVKDKGE